MFGVALGVAATALLLLVAALWWKPPDLIRVGANYTAKTVCSNVFLAGRDADEVLRTDVQAPGHPLLRVMRVSVNSASGVVRAGLFGFIGGGLAVARPGMGCTVVPDAVLPVGDAQQSDSSEARVVAYIASVRRPSALPDEPWPDGAAVRTAVPIDRVIADDTLAGPGRSHWYGR